MEEEPLKKKKKKREQLEVELAGLQATEPGTTATPPQESTETQPIVTPETGSWEIGLSENELADEAERRFDLFRKKELQVENQIRNGSFPKGKYLWERLVKSNFYCGLYPELFSMFEEAGIVDDSDPRILNLRPRVVRLLRDNGIISELAQEDLLQAIFNLPETRKNIENEEREEKEKRENDPEYLALLETSNFEQVSQQIYYITQQLRLAVLEKNEARIKQLEQQGFDVIQSYPGYYLMGEPDILPREEEFDGEIWIKKIFSVKETVGSNPLGLDFHKTSFLVYQGNESSCLISPVKYNIDEINDGFFYNPENPDQNFSDRKMTNAIGILRSVGDRVILESFVLPFGKPGFLHLAPKKPALVSIRKFNPTKKYARHNLGNLVSLEDVKVMGELEPDEEKIRRLVENGIVIKEREEKTPANVTTRGPTIEAWTDEDERRLKEIEAEIAALENEEKL